MHISLIHYTESQSTEIFIEGGLRQWNKKEYAVSVHLNDGDDENKADELAKQFVREKLAAKPVPQDHYFAANEPPIPIVQTERKQTGFEHWVSEIQKTTTIEGIDGLEGLRLIAQSTPALQSVFNEQMEKLKSNLK